MLSIRLWNGLIFRVLSLTQSGQENSTPQVTAASTVDHHRYDLRLQMQAAPNKPEFLRPANTLPPAPLPVVASHIPVKSTPPYEWQPVGGGEEEEKEVRRLHRLICLTCEPLLQMYKVLSHHAPPWCA